MLGMSTDVVSYKLPINPGFISMKHKNQKFKTNLC